MLYILGVWTNVSSQVGSDQGLSLPQKSWKRVLMGLALCPADNLLLRQTSGAGRKGRGDGKEPRCWETLLDLFVWTVTVNLRASRWLGPLLSVGLGPRCSHLIPSLCLKLYVSLWAALVLSLFVMSTWPDLWFRLTPIFFVNPFSSFWSCKNVWQQDGMFEIRATRKPREGMLVQSGLLFCLILLADDFLLYFWQHQNPQILFIL